MKKRLNSSDSKEKLRLAKVKKMTLLDKMGNNPFIGEDFNISVREFWDKSLFRVSDGVNIPYNLKMDKGNSVKIFNEAKNRRVISMLNSSAQRLYLFILYNMRYSEDYIKINKKRYMEENKISSINTYKRGLRELETYSIIYESNVRGVYWINPRFVFCGNRVSKYPENVVK